VKGAALMIPISIGFIVWGVMQRPGTVSEAGAPDTTQLSGRAVGDATADDLAERDALLARIATLEARIAGLQADALRREEQWVEYNEMIVAIAPEDLFPELHVEKVKAALADAPPPEPDPAELARAERSGEIQRSFTALLRADGIDAFDVLEMGLLGDGWIGPVLLRSFDGRGRAIGSLSAARLRLEGSQAGRTLTIVLEDGYARRSGEKIPFPGTEAEQERGGVRRFVLPHTDPRPWLTKLPELFREELAQEVLDDGRWNSFIVRRELNARLDRAGLGGRYVLKAFAGVREDVFRDVALDEFDESGALRRRLFADRLAVRIDNRGVHLLLEDGVAVRGEQKLPFLDGRMRLFLPRADVEEWTNGGIPVVDVRNAGDAPLETPGDAQPADPH